MEPLSIEQIRAYLPHRAPFLLVDRVISVITATGEAAGKGPLNSDTAVGIEVTAIKNVTYNEPHFTGHFPKYAIMPGVLIIEALAQTSSFTIYPFANDEVKAGKGIECILVGVDEARFRKPVVPGDVLTLKTKVTRCRGKIWNFDAEALVDGKRVAEAKLMANLVTPV